MDVLSVSRLLLWTSGVVHVALREKLYVVVSLSCLCYPMFNTRFEHLGKKTKRAVVNKIQRIAS